eukprot:1179951-Prorocentrum_minimum.AAC.1
MVVGAWDGRVVEGAACCGISAPGLTPSSVGEWGEFQMDIPPPRIPAAADSGAGQVGHQGPATTCTRHPTPRDRREVRAHARQAEQAKLPQGATNTHTRPTTTHLAPTSPGRWTRDVVGGSTGCTETSQNGESRPLPPRRAVEGGDPTVRQIREPEFAGPPEAVSTAVSFGPEDSTVL